MPYGLTVDKRLIMGSRGGLYKRVRNNRGSAVVAGDVVIWDTTVLYPAITVTTTQDDAKVAGVVVENIPNGESGLIQVTGIFEVASAVKVNGTTAIAVGDVLSTFTTAGIAAKATAGKAGSFAIALEAYSVADSNGTIDALLVNPSLQDASATVSYGTAGQMAADGLQAANAAGTTAATARIDHAHAFTNDVPAPILGTTNAVGTVGSVMSSNASLAIFDTVSPTTIGFADSAAVGTAAFAARRDHAHASPAASTAPIDGSSDAASNATGTSAAIARADHAHKAITLDDVVHAYGSDSDVGAYMPNGGVAANTTKAGVLEGTPVIQASPNGSLITGVITDGGDWVVAVSPAGNSLEAIRVDSSTSQVQLGEGVLDTVQWDGTGLIVGSTAQRTLNALVPEFQVQGTVVGVDGAAAVMLYSATASEGPEVILARSKSGVLGTNTIVASGDSLGRILAAGADGGTGFDPAAAIQFEVDGVPGVLNDMPGRIVFLTSPDASQTPTESFRVSSTQDVIIANNNGLVVGYTAQLLAGQPSAEAQILGTTAGDSSLMLQAASVTDTVMAGLYFVKDGGATLGGAGQVANGEDIGEIVWYGGDTNDLTNEVARIKVQIDAAAGLADTPGRLIFSTTADGASLTTEVMRLTSAQNVAVGDANGLIVGALTQQTLSNGAGAALIPEVQVQGTAQADSHAGFLRNSLDALGPGVTFSKSRNATIGSFTIVADADVLGQLIFAGDDGVDYMATGAIVRAEVDGTPAVGGMPGSLRFMTSASGAESPTSRMYINAAGAVFIGSTDVSTFTGSGGSLIFDEIVAPAGTATNQAQIYAYDVATVTVIAQQKSDGVNADL